MRTVVTKEDFKNALRESNRNYTGQSTWGTLYGANYLLGETAKAQTINQYNDAMAQAYQSSLQQRSAISSSPYSENYKAMVNTELDKALDTAYNQYMTQQSSDLSSISSSVASNKSQIDELLEIEAQYNLDYKAAQEDYYNFLYNYYNENATQDNIFLDNPLWKQKYLVKIDDASVLDSETIPMAGREEGEEYRLKTIDELSKDFYDEKGNLTAAGKDFYDQIVNTVGVEEGWSAPSFTDYLIEQDKKNKTDLYSWSVSENPYNIATDATGRNRHSATYRQLLGLNSEDETYQFLERFGGLNKEELETKFNEDIAQLKSSIDEASSDYAAAHRSSAKDKSKNSKIIYQSFKDIESDLTDLASTYGISSEEMNQILKPVRYKKSDIANLSASDDVEKELKEAYLDAITKILMMAESNRVKAQS